MAQVRELRSSSLWRWVCDSAAAAVDQLAGLWTSVPFSVHTSRVFTQEKLPWVTATTRPVSCPGALNPPSPVAATCGPRGCRACSGSWYKGAWGARPTGGQRVTMSPRTSLGGVSAARSEVQLKVQEVIGPPCREAAAPRRLCSKRDRIRARR